MRLGCGWLRLRLRLRLVRPNFFDECKPVAGGTESRCWDVTLNQLNQRPFECQVILGGCVEGLEEKPIARRVGAYEGRGQLGSLSAAVGA
jgi:hypothetical protein